MDLSCYISIDSKQGALRAVRFNVDGSYCLTCGTDKKIKLWNPYRNLMLKIYGGHGNDVFDATSSSDSTNIVSCSSDKSVILWDVESGQPLRRLRGHAGTVCCVKYNEDSSIAISGSHDNTVMCWDMKSRKNSPVQVLKDAKDCITSIQITDHQILTSSVDCHTRIYDIRMGNMTSDFIGAPVTYSSFTRDGQCVVASSSDDTVRLIDRQSGELLSTYSGHSTKEYAVENFVSRADSHVFSGSATGHVWCWDLISSRVACKLVHDEGSPVHSLSGHPGKDVFLSASRGEFKLWGSESDLRTT